MLQQQNRSHNVVNQQKDSFDVDPAFFEADKVKINEFLTDDKEYIRKKLIQDCPNGDFRNLDVNTNLLELQSRIEKDESAFEEINQTMNIRSGSVINDFEIAKTRAINTLASEPTQVVTSKNYSEKQLNQIGKGLTKQMKVISAQTEALLKAEHTKILDLNEINESMISRGERVDSGGTETSDVYNSVDGGVNKYNTLKRIHDINSKLSENYKIDDDSIEDLSTLKVNNQEVTYDSLPSKPLTKRLTVNTLSNSVTRNISSEGNDRMDVIPEQIVQPRTPTKTFKLEPEQQPPRQQTVQFNQTYQTAMFSNKPRTTESLYGAGSLASRGSSRLNEPAQITKIDDLIVRDITEKTNKFMNTRQLLDDNVSTSNRTSTINLNRTTSSLYRSQPINNDRLIPFNEVKMDQRIRKSQRREYKFINGGNF